MKYVRYLCLISAMVFLVGGCETQKENEPETKASETAVSTEAKQPKTERGGVQKGGFVLRINCGSEADYKDNTGNVWAADHMHKDGVWGYVGGKGIERDPTKVKKAKDGEIYLTERYGLSAYRIPVPNGTYDVTLHFAETYEDLWGAGERVYSVFIEDACVLKDFDPLKETDNEIFTAIQKKFKIKVTDGELTIGFKENIQAPMINGIEVLQKR